MDHRPPWQRALPRRKPTGPPLVERIPDILPNLNQTAIQIMSKLIRPFIENWLPRQLLKFLTVAGAAIGATSDEVAGTVGFIVAGISFGVELLFSWISARLIKSAVSPRP